MLIALHMALWLLAAFSALAAMLYALIAARIVRALRSVPRAAEGLNLAPTDDELPSVCVLVPAHNEQRVIGGVVESLVGQDYPRLRIVFALDRCTDNTRRIIEETSNGDGRVEIIEIDECPDDWAGKPHALMRGVRDSEGAHGADLLLFVDADAVLDGRCVRAAVGLLLDRRLDLVSFLSTLSRRRWFERLVQPMAVFELMRQHPLDRVNRQSGPTSFANGQFLLFRRSSYEAMGGHRRVRRALLEDIALARAIKEDGGRFGVFIAGAMLRCRMYGSWESFCWGWRRIFIESTRRRASTLRRYARRVRLVHSVGPVAAMTATGAGAAGVVLDQAPAAPAALAALAAGAAALTAWLLAMILACRSQGASVGSALLSPIGAWMTGSILAQAADDLQENRPVRWGGRDYTFSDGDIDGDRDAE